MCKKSRNNIYQRRVKTLCIVKGKNAATVIFICIKHHNNARNMVQVQT